MGMFALLIPIVILYMIAMPFILIGAYISGIKEAEREEEKQADYFRMLRETDCREKPMPNWWKQKYGNKTQLWQL